MSVYKAHEIRMWLVQVVMPVTVVTYYVCKKNNVVPKIKQKIKNRKNTVKA